MQNLHIKYKFDDTNYSVQTNKNALVYHEDMIHNKIHINENNFFDLCNIINIDTFFDI